jgi:hypothetical protein
VEDLLGTWVNEDYLIKPAIGCRRSKLIINPDGTIENDETSIPGKFHEIKRATWTYTVTDSWVDFKRIADIKLLFLEEKLI